MKKLFILLISVFSIQANYAQEQLIDHWQSIQTFSTVSSIHDYNVSTVVNNKILMVVDTFTGGLYNLSGLYTYDINTRNIGNINFPLAGGDRGIKCATNYKTSTAGLEYGVFGCYALSDAGPSYPVIYTYNAQNGTVTADSL
ncbi:MAG: hypothetical protein HY062_09235, partial [Bacteroidetes bacterium]|nr:hypothetical protein [Bacteroidota bacterium]